MEIQHAAPALRRLGSGEALRAAIPWVVLAAALALTATGWLALERSRAANARSHFERRGEIVVAALAGRMASVEALMHACAAHVAAARSITPADWRAFVGHLELSGRYPALQSLDYFEKPQDRPGAERARLRAMEAALAAGNVAVSSKLTLPDADGASAPAGFAMYLPVTRDSESAAETIAPGFVSADVRIHDLLRGILDGDAQQVLDLRIYDGARIAPAAVLVDTRSESAAAPLFQRKVAFPVPGRAWSLEFVSRPEFDEAFESDRPWGVLAAALAASFLVFLLARALAASLERAHELSMRDPLTGLFNRRYLDETMEREIERAARVGESVGVIVLDIDHFKLLNDSLGHDAGDHVLARTGELLRHATRGSDIACRFGGEEFGLILPGASLRVARDRAEAIRALFEGTPFEFEGRKVGPLTLSAGIAALPPEGGDWSAVLQRADRALYTAKQAGRNRVLAAAPE